MTSWKPKIHFARFWLIGPVDCGFPRMAVTHDSCVIQALKRRLQNALAGQQFSRNLNLRHLELMTRAESPPLP